MATGLLPLLGQISNAFTTPTANPLYGAQYLTTDDHPDIPNAGWYDVNGKDVTDKISKLPKEQQSVITSQPYVQPNWFQRLGSTGASEAMSNAQAEAQAGAQARQEQIAKNTWLTRNAANPYVGSSIKTNPNAAYSEYGGMSHVDPSLWNTEATAAAGISNGNPQQSAITTNNELKAEQQLAANKANQYAVEGLLNTPLTTASANDLGEQTRQMYNSGDLAMAPQSIWNKGAGLSLEAGKLQGQQNVLPIQNQELYNRSLLGEGSSAQSVQDWPYIQSAQRAGDITGAYTAENPPGLYQSPFNAHVNNDEGTLTLGRTPPQQAMLGNMAMGGDTQSVKMPDGTLHTVPTTATVNPATGQDMRTSNHTPGTISGEAPKQLEDIANMPGYSYDEKGNYYRMDANGHPVPITVDKDSPIDAQAKSQRYLKKKVKEGHQIPVLPHGTPNILGRTALGVVNNPLTHLAPTLLYKGLGKLSSAISGE